MTKGQDPVHQAETLGNLLHNQQAALAIQALLQHRGEFNALNARLAGVGPDVVQRDFATALASPITQTRLLTEDMSQLTRTIGEGFVPVLRTLDGALKTVNDAFSWMDEHFPELSKYTKEAAGSFLLLLGTMGTLGFVLPIVGNGFKLIMGVFDMFGVFKLAGLAGTLLGVEKALGGMAALSLGEVAAGLSALVAPLTAIAALVGGAAWIAHGIGELNSDPNRAPQPQLVPPPRDPSPDARGDRPVRLDLSVAPGLVLKPAGGDFDLRNSNIRVLGRD
jgi:hypothetical protein